MSDDEIKVTVRSVPADPKAGASDFPIDASPISPRDFLENVAAFQARINDASAGYNQIVVLAGYAAFFAIWSTLAPDTDRTIVRISGGLMLVSVSIYVGWTVVKMYAMQAHVAEMTNEIAKGVEDFRARINAAEKRGIDLSAGLMKFWKPVVWSAGLTALAAAVMVAGAAFLAVTTR